MMFANIAPLHYSRSLLIVCAQDNLSMLYVPQPKGVTFTDNLRFPTWLGITFARVNRGIVDGVGTKEDQ